MVLFMHTKISQTNWLSRPFWQKKLLRTMHSREKVWKWDSPFSQSFLGKSPHCQSTVGLCGWPHLQNLVDDCASPLWLPWERWLFPTFGSVGNAFRSISITPSSCSWGIKVIRIGRKIKTISQKCRSLWKRASTNHQECKLFISQLISTTCVSKNLWWRLVLCLMWNMKWCRKGLYWVHVDY